MKREIKGFTLGELLISLVIISILSFLLISFYVRAKERAAQRSTMADMKMWSDAITSYISDHSVAPANPRGTMHFKKAIIKELSPYLKAIRISDWWENSLLIWTGKGIKQYGITTQDEKEFIIVSFGEDGFREGWKYDPTNPDAGFFDVKDFEDFRKDLVLWSNKFVRCPRQK